MLWIWTATGLFVVFLIGELLARLFSKKRNNFVSKSWKVANETRAGDIQENSSFSLWKRYQDSLDWKNLFKEVSLINHNLTKLWEDICDQGSQKLKKLGEIIKDASSHNEPPKGGREVRRLMP